MEPVGSSTFSSHIGPARISLHVPISECTKALRHNQTILIFQVLKDAGRTCYHRIIAAAGVFVGFAFAILQLRDLVRTRQTDLVLRSHSMFGSREFQEAWVETMRMEFSDYQEYLKKYGAASEKPSFAAVNMVASFFEDMGILLHRKLVDIALIDDLFSSDIIITWRKLYPIVQGWRKQFNRPQISEWFEYLHNEIQKREQELNRVRQ